MTKNTYKLEDNDFGFSAVSEEELKLMENQLKEEVSKKSEELVKVEETYKGKLNQLYNTIIPLLDNLLKNPDKAYIYWPNRSDKIEKFKNKIDKIAGIDKE